ncbi:MAG TPA: orotidine-5'-phosphate decarboxylase [Acidimicrobiales bacterium]|nr:orotidine-5'-phosphate decarboxylase [Acidimicrobiales bacterium]
MPELNATDGDPEPYVDRSRLAVALDLEDSGDALALAKELAPWFGVAKVGYELYAAAGPAIVEPLRALDMQVFLDLKLHDIPTTVGRGARVLGRLGATYLNFHAAGGEAMLRAGVEGFAAGAAEAGHSAPVSLGVTVLTSDQPDEGLLIQRASTAAAAGCGGVVCAATDVGQVRTVFRNAVTMVPGIRTEGAGVDDQVRVATPVQAFNLGADVIILGRSVTRADDPTAVAAGLFASLSRLG